MIMDSVSIGFCKASVMFQMANDKLKTTSAFQQVAPEMNVVNIGNDVSTRLKVVTAECQVADASANNVTCDPCKPQGGEVTDTVRYTPTDQLSCEPCMALALQVNGQPYQMALALQVNGQPYQMSLALYVNDQPSQKFLIKDLNLS